MNVLQINTYFVSKVDVSNKFEISNETLSLNLDIPISLKDYQYIKEINISVINPNDHEIFVNQILDVIPISTKVYGNIGAGVTNTIIGCYTLLTACDIEKNQFFNFGISSGILSEHIQYDRPGTFTKDDWLIHIDVVTKKDTIDKNEAVLEIHQIADQYLNEIRLILKKADISLAFEKITFNDVDQNTTKNKVVIVKQAAGGGVMNDHLLFANQPSGVIGGRTIIGLKDFPVLLTPNEYRDGAIHALT